MAKRKQLLLVLCAWKLFCVYVCMRLHKRRMYAYVSTFARKALYLIKKGVISVRVYQTHTFSYERNRLKWILVFIHSCQMWKCRCMCFELRNCNKLFCSFISIAIDRVQSTYVKMYAEAPIDNVLPALSIYAMSKNTGMMKSLSPFQPCW